LKNKCELFAEIIAFSLKKSYKSKLSFIVLKSPAVAGLDYSIWIKGSGEK